MGVDTLNLCILIRTCQPSIKVVLFDQADVIDRWRLLTFEFSNKGMRRWSNMPFFAAICIYYQIFRTSVPLNLYGIYRVRVNDIELCRGDVTFETTVSMASYAMSLHCGDCSEILLRTKWAPQLLNFPIYLWVVQIERYKLGKRNH